MAIAEINFQKRTSPIQNFRLVYWSRKTVTRDRPLVPFCWTAILISTFFFSTLKRSQHATAKLSGLWSSASSEDCLNTSLYPFRWDSLVFPLQISSLLVLTAKLLFSASPNDSSPFCLFLVLYVDRQQRSPRATKMRRCFRDLESFILTCYNWLYNLWRALRIQFENTFFVNNSSAFQYYTKAFFGNHS